MELIAPLSVVIIFFGLGCLLGWLSEQPVTTRLARWWDRRRFYRRWPL